MLRLQKDGTNIAYRIPASSVNEELKHVNAFMESLAMLPCEIVELVIPYDIAPGWVIKRKIIVNHLFLLSVGKTCTMRKSFSTRISGRGIVLESFCKLFSEESTRCSLNIHHQKGLRRLAKPWMACSLNLGTRMPARTTPHKDIKCAMEGRSCLYFGDFRGGHVVLWEIKAILELRAGDIL